LESPVPGVWTMVMSNSLIDELLPLLPELSKEFSRSSCKIHRNSRKNVN